MSSVVYGALSRKRVDAPPGTSFTSSAPALNPYVDIISALLPAEALAAFHYLIGPDKPLGDEDSQWAFWGFLFLSVLLYVFGRVRTSKSTPHMPDHVLDEVIRAAIPAAAMALWILWESPDLVPFAQHWSSFRQGFAAIAGSLIVLITSFIFGHRAHRQTPPNA